MNTVPVPDNPEQLIATNQFVDYADAVDAVVHAHVTDDVLAERLRAIVQNAHARTQQAEISSAAAAEPTSRGRVGVDPSRAFASPELTLPVFNGRWKLRSEILSRRDSSSRHETRAAVDLTDTSQPMVVKWASPAAKAADAATLEPISDRLRMEAQRQAAIDSPYVAPVVDSGYAPGFGYYIVTNRYNGTLADRLKYHGDELNLGWALRVTAQILQGLFDCLTQTGIVHLDIKPSNVALDNFDRVRLIDFGLATPVSDPDGDRVDPRPGFTTFYAPPEQMLRLPDRGWCTSACDIRAVGATLYEIITGAPPLYRDAQAANLVDANGRFRSEGTRFLVKWMNTDRVAPPGTIVSWLPSTLNDLVMTWLDPNPLVRGSLRTAQQDLIAVQLELSGSAVLDTSLRASDHPFVDVDSTSEPTVHMPHSTYA